jgi:hypothetical protein
MLGQAQVAPLNAPQAAAGAAAGRGHLCRFGHERMAATRRGGAAHPSGRSRRPLGARVIRSENVDAR